MAETRVVTLGNGLELAWTEFGAHDGRPVMAFHGSPGTGHHFAAVDKVAAARGVRLIAPDRPGYGHSTFDPGRTFEGWATVVGELADHLTLDRFTVVGHSSGAPNAAACARFLGDRVIACAIVSGPCPEEAKVSNGDATLILRITQGLIPLMPRLMSLGWQAGLRRAQRDPDMAVSWMARMLPPCDVAVVRRADIAASVRAELARPLSATAGRATVQDIRLERRPWGFELRDIRIPVHVWHGDCDRNVAFDNGVHQGREIPEAVFHGVSGSGHWMHFERFGEILDSVI
jgi:pimeloyl-ACP methyl ester carboxylesterase